MIAIIPTLRKTFLNDGQLMVRTTWGWRTKAGHVTTVPYRLRCFIQSPRGAVFRIVTLRVIRDRVRRCPESAQSGFKFVVKLKKLSDFNLAN